MLTGVPTEILSHSRLTHFIGVTLRLDPASELATAPPASTE
jgi:hypothetical protein